MEGPHPCAQFRERKPWTNEPRSEHGMIQRVVVIVSSIIYASAVEHGGGLIGTVVRIGAPLIAEPRSAGL